MGYLMSYLLIYFQYLPKINLVYVAVLSEINFEQ